MTGYMLIWLLLQRIDALEKELDTYKNNTNEKK